MSSRSPICPRSSARAICSLPIAVVSALRTEVRHRCGRLDASAPTTSVASCRKSPRRMRIGSAAMLRIDGSERPIRATSSEMSKTELETASSRRAYRSHSHAPWLAARATAFAAKVGAAGSWRSVARSACATTRRVSNAIADLGARQTTVSQRRSPPRCSHHHGSRAACARERLFAGVGDPEIWPAMSCICGQATKGSPKRLQFPRTRKRLRSSAQPELVPGDPNLPPGALKIGVEPQSPGKGKAGRGELDPGRRFGKDGPIPRR